MKMIKKKNKKKNQQKKQPIFYQTKHSRGLNTNGINKEMKCRCCPQRQSTKLTDQREPTAVRIIKSRLFVGFKKQNSYTHLEQNPHRPSDTKTLRWFIRAERLLFIKIIPRQTCAFFKTNNNRNIRACF